MEVGCPTIFDKCYGWEDAKRAREQGVYPYFRPIEQSKGTRVIIEGRELLMAGSNNYLGLATDPRIEEAAIDAIRKYGASCSGSRFMNGTLALHEELEERLADFTQTESALCFTTGYQTNLGSISALVGRSEHIFTDKYNHASIMDGIFLSRGMNHSIFIHRYKHNNPRDLEAQISLLPESAPKIIVTDGVFSMEGDIVDLPAIRKIADRYRAGIYLDEAHAVGVLGPTGRGTTEHYGGKNLTDLIMCTFSKSFGSIGGFISGPADIVDYIKHFARPLIFSASVPPGNIGAVMKALEIIVAEPERVTRLQQIAAKMIAGFKEAGFNVGTAQTPIVPLIIGDFDKTLLFWKRLFERGVYVNPVIAPAVPPNRSLLRTSYMATHTDKDLDMILEIAAEEGKRAGVIGEAAA